MIWLALLCSLAGFLCLAFVMDRHASDVLGRAPRRRECWLARGAGIALLAVALTACIAAEGVSIGITAWLGVMTPAALLIGLGLTWWSAGAGKPAGRARR